MQSKNLYSLIFLSLICYFFTIAAAYPIPIMKKKDAESSELFYQIYFPNDSTSLDLNHVKKLKKIADEFSSEPTQHLFIEGNTDKRGSKNYNYNLAKRRAETIKNFFTAFNIDPKQIQVTSYGSDKPLASGPTFQDYALNRRVDLSKNKAATSNIQSTPSLALPSQIQTKPSSSKKVIPLIAIATGLNIVNSPLSAYFEDDLSSYQYHSDNSRLSPLLDISTGIEWKMSPVFSLQTLISYIPTFQTKQNGTLVQDLGTGEPYYLPYQYKVDSNQFLFELKGLLTFKERYHPYFSVGGGLALNKAYAYHVDYDRSHFKNFSPLFESHTTNSGAYRLETGLDVNLNQQVRLGAGYSFSDLGTVKLGQGSLNQIPIANTLESKHFYNQEILARLTFLF